MVLKSDFININLCMYFRKIFIYFCFLLVVLKFSNKFFLFVVVWVRYDVFWDWGRGLVVRIGFWLGLWWGRVSYSVGFFYCILIYIDWGLGTSLVVIIYKVYIVWYLVIFTYLIYENMIWCKMFKILMIICY